MQRGVHLLSSVQALQPGADLWIMSTPETSSFARNIDWHLNFQISRGLQNQSRRRSDPLEALLKKIRWNLPAQVTLPESPLLISALGRLPTQWVLLPEKWNSELSFLAAAAKLRPQKIRVFLPATLSPNLFRAVGAGPVVRELTQNIEIEIIAET